nr:hypothetical protein CFP56_56435 [Quercus suber]
MAKRFFIFISRFGVYPVTPAMGKQSFDGPECINEIRLKIEESKRQLKKKNPYLCGEKLLCRIFQRPIHQKAFKGSPRLKDDTTCKDQFHGDQHSTSSVVHSQDGPAKCQLKPDYEELKLIQGKILMKLASYATPATKKGNLRGGGDKTIRPIFILWELGKASVVYHAM